MVSKVRCGRDRHSIVLPAVAMLFQLAAATWVPVVHPLLHHVSHDEVLITSTPGADHELEAQLDDSCLTKIFNKNNHIFDNLFIMSTFLFFGLLI